MRTNQRNLACFDNAQPASYYESDANICYCKLCGNKYDADDFPTDVCEKCYNFWELEQQRLDAILNFLEGKNHEKES